MSRIAVGFLLLCASIGVFAESCPAYSVHRPTHPAVTLHGTLTYHDELREWIGLKLDQKVCNVDEIQLLFDKLPWQSAMALRNCGVSVSGELYESPTGYYSADFVMQGDELKVDSSCRPLPVKSDPPPVKISPKLSQYKVRIAVDFHGKGHIDVVAWGGTDKYPLQPWETYANYTLTGSGDVMWVGCGEKFTVGQLSVKPKSLDIFQDENLNGVTFKNISGVNTITFTCAR